jgi:hypothetical protein
MTDKTYYWIGEGQFGGGDDAVKFGEKMPKIDDKQLKVFLEKGWVSDTVQVSERKLTELEEVKAELAKLKESGGSGITKEQLDEAFTTSVQADLDEIKALKESDFGELKGQLDLVKEALSKTQQGDSKAEIWDAVKSVKDLLEG